MIIGVDEAGKGPVLGPMFVVGIKSSEFSTRIPDSKTLSDSRRKELFEDLSEVCEFSVVQVSPSEIDKKNMNEIVIKCHADVISSLYQESDLVFCDACLSDESSYRKRLFENLEMDFEGDNFTCENSADDSYDVVGAASVIAKQKREDYMDFLNSFFDMDIGSGYPSDPKTIDFLEEFYEENGELPKFARKSWSTCDSITQSSLDNF